MKKALVLMIGLLFFGANAYAANGDLVVNGDVTVAGTVNGAATKLTDGTNLIHTKIIDIGVWNMYSLGAGSGSKNVAHGLDATKIRGVSAIIRTDVEAYSTRYSITGVIGGPSPAGTISFNDTHVAMTRVGLASNFDNANYRSTSVNRGWITITYVD